MIEDMESFRLPRYAQIPNVGLYLEQVVRYVNAHLAPLGEPELTSSMVSNYVKQSLISAPIKKTYPSEHLARLLFIAVVKPVVPLEGLRLMFSIQGDSYPLPTAYDYFCDEFENMLGAAFGIAPAREGLGETQSDAKDLLRNTISGHRQQGLSGSVSGGVPKTAGKGAPRGAAEITEVIAGKKDSSRPALSPIERTVQLRLYRPFLLPARCPCSLYRRRERSVPAADRAHSLRKKPLSLKRDPIVPGFASHETLLCSPSGSSAPTV